MWTTPRTWTTGETITASILNVHIRDDLTYLYSPPRVRARHDSNQSIPGGEVRPVELAKVEYDNDGMRELTIDPSPYSAAAMVQVKTAGCYIVTGSAAFGLGVTNTRLLGSFGGPSVLSASIIVLRGNPNVGVTSPAKLNVKTLWQFAVDDVAGLFVQVSGTPDPVDLLATYAGSPAMAMHWKGN